MVRRTDWVEEKKKKKQTNDKAISVRDYVYSRAILWRGIFTSICLQRERISVCSTTDNNNSQIIYLLFRIFVWYLMKPSFESDDEWAEFMLTHMQF